MSAVWVIAALTLALLVAFVALFGVVPRRIARPRLRRRTHARVKGGR